MKTTDNKNKNGWSPDQLDRALAIAEDLLTRAQIPFLVLGKTLDGVLKDSLDCDKIELGIRKRYLTRATSGMLKTVMRDLEIGEDKICFEHESVPVEIKIIKRNYKCLKNPDKVFYRVTEYYIPNPMSEYNKVRHFIK